MNFMGNSTGGPVTWGGIQGGDMQGANIPLFQFISQMMSQPGGAPTGGLMSAFPVTPEATNPWGMNLALPSVAGLPGTGGAAAPTAVSNTAKRTFGSGSGGTPSYKTPQWQGK